MEATVHSTFRFLLGGSARVFAMLRRDGGGSASEMMMTAIRSPLFTSHQQEAREDDGLGVLKCRLDTSYMLVHTVWLLIGRLYS